MSTMENTNSDPLAESPAASQCQRPKDQIESVEYKFDALSETLGFVHASNNEFITGSLNERSTDTILQSLWLAPLAQLLSSLQAVTK